MVRIRVSVRVRVRVSPRLHGRLEVSTQREAQLEAEEAALRDEVEKLQKQLDERSKLADSSSTEQQRLLGSNDEKTEQRTRAALELPRTSSALRWPCSWRSR